MRQRYARLHPIGALPRILELCDGHVFVHRAKSSRGLLLPMVERSCSFKGCVNAAVAYGLCQTHRTQQRKGQPLRALRHRPPTAARWAFDGCTRPGHAKGLCAAHYKQQLRGESLRELRQNIPADSQCSFQGCTKPVSARDLCAGHYQRLRKGQPLRALRHN